ncbi:hypothetical protein CIK74_03695 [Glutamicibacter sp. BW77]|nr:hypothetical protein CIK74_03695 [Glutamicibacter sp. BW77]
MHTKFLRDELATKIPLVPDAQLLESMRAVGYSFSTALADIIDNSISAGATTIRIVALPSAHRTISILDNGKGMDLDEAMTAMKLAGRSSSDSRRRGDLGRFGLGLKTASLSQGRVLTLATRRDGKTSILRWDLDHVAAVGEWELLLLDREEASSIQELKTLESLRNGTLVVWENLDRFDDHYEGYIEHLANELKEAKDHIGLVFHRFLDDAVTAARDVSIFVNNAAVKPATPLLEKNPSTIPGPIQSEKVADSSIKIQSFTLPHRSKMSDEEFATAQIGSTFRDSQGFYVYRENRLVIWGTWFRMATKQELGKLARVAVEIPNVLDHLWSLDIKKSQAVPPPAVRERLRTYANRMIEPSKRVFTYKGRTVSTPSFAPLWNVVQLRDGFTVEINDDNPLIQALLHVASDEDQKKTINSALSLLERSIPIDNIFNRLGKDEIFSSDDTSEELEKIADGLANAMKGSFENSDKFVESFINTPPFEGHSMAETILRRSFEAA